MDWLLNAPHLEQMDERAPNNTLKHAWGYKYTLKSYIWLINKQWGVYNEHAKYCALWLAAVSYLDQTSKTNRPDFTSLIQHTLKSPTPLLHIWWTFQLLHISQQHTHIQTHTHTHTHTQTHTHTHTHTHTLMGLQRVLAPPVSTCHSWSQLRPSAALPFSVCPLTVLQTPCFLHPIIPPTHLNMHNPYYSRWYTIHTCLCVVGLSPPQDQ